MRIVVDYDRCEGHGLCSHEAPQVFELDDYGDLTVLDPEPAADLRPALDSAVIRCPTGAISLVD